MDIQLYLQLTIYSMSQQDNPADQYEVIIVECCENCESHQSFSRHSQWKYFQQFNQLKRKLQRFVNNAIVVKNPVPDELIKPAQARLPVNHYINKQTNQNVVFPRIGAFQIYIYNVLIYSKLLTNAWPNHYKLIQLITKIIEQKKKGNSLQDFSVFQQTQPVTVQQKVEKPPIKPPQKKKKKDYRVYKSKQKWISNQSPVRKPSNLDPINSTNKKPGRRTLLEKDKDTIQLRNTQTKMQNRIKLPSLRNTISFKESQGQEGNLNANINDQKSSARYSNERISQSKQQSLKKIFNSIDQLQKQDLSFIQRKQSIEDNPFNSLILQANQSMQMRDPREQQQIKMLEDRSVQYSQKEEQKDFMNRQIQYEVQQGRYLDFSIQVDDGSRPKQKNSHFVQTDKVDVAEPKQQQKKPYMLDEEVTVNIVIPKNEKHAETQTIQKQYKQYETNTELKVIINRACQFPQQQVKPVPKDQFNTIDAAYTHLFQKRRNLADNSCFSIDKFEQKATRYKWIGRANQKKSIDQIRKSFLYQCLVFCFYNYFGIKIPEKRLSFQACSNVVVEEKSNKIVNTALVHVMTMDNPEVQYMNQFQEYDDQNTKYPLSQILTFRNSKQKIKFVNYGGFLALAYFLGDSEVFGKDKYYMGVVISNQQVKEIIKLRADGYKIAQSANFLKSKIFVDRSKDDQQGCILLERTSQQIEMEFISMISKILDNQVFSEMLKYYQQTFIHFSPSHKIFRNALLSMKTDKVDSQILQQFMDMLKKRKQLIQQHHKGQIYSYQKYRSLQPKIKFNTQNYAKKIDTKQLYDIERKFLYNEKIVTSSQIQKHFRSKDTFVIIVGQSGAGKTSFISNVSQNLDLKYGDKLRIQIVSKQILNDEVLMKKKVDEILDEYRKQVIVIDDAQFYFMQIIQFIQKIYSKQDPRTKPQMSFCLASSIDPIKLKIRLSGLGIQVVQCAILPLQVQEIRTYMMKAIQFHNFTDKKNFLQQLLGTENVSFTEAHPKFSYIKIVRNPFYLKAYCDYLNNIEDISNLNACLMNRFNKYSILKQMYGICWNRHLRQCKQMGVKFEDCLHNLRKIAFEYYVNNFIINQSIRQTVSKHTTSQIINNQLAFYPVHLDALVKNNKDLFIHRQYLYYFVAQAYCFYLEKAYRNMCMAKLYSNWQLLCFIKDRYNIEKTHSKLMEVIQKSRKYKSTWQQASNAITLLNKIQFTFSNYNFDEVQIPQADLTQGVFYNCTFRSTNLNNVIMYKTQMMNCLVDNAKLDNVNLFVKKFQIQYTVVSASLSMDGRNLALGCGNYLIVLQTDTGKQLKKIEAHMDIIRTVKYSKDNYTLITIADDKTLRMWDTRSYRSVVFKLPQKGTIAFSSQTDMIASVTKNSLKVWNIKSMANQFQLEGHSDLITVLQFSNDGKYIVTGSRDTTIRIWSTSLSTKKGEIVRVFKGHSAEILTLNISPSRSTIVSSSKDKDIVVWGFDNAAEISKKRFPDEITQICLDQKQKFIAIALSKQNYINILHVETLDIVYTFQGHKGRIISLNFDTNFRKLVSLGRDKTVKIWDFDRIMECQQKKYLQNKKSNLKITKGPILSIAFCKSSNKYATSHQNGEVNIFSAVDNRHIQQLISHNGAVQCLQFDKSGKIYAAGSDGSVRIWNLSARRQPRVLDLHSCDIIQMKLNERHRIIATSSIAQQLVVVDFTGIKIVMSTKEEGKVEAIQFSKDQKIMAVGGSQKYIAIYQIGEGGNSINRVQQLGPNVDNVVSMSFHGDAYLVVALKNGHIAIWNHLRSTLSKKIQNTSVVNSILSFQKKYVCFSSEDGKLRVVDMDEGKQIKIFRLPQKCNSFTTNSNQSLLYQATENGNISIWNLGSLKERQEKVEFDRVAFDEQGLKIAQIEGPKQLLIRDLHFHEEEFVKVKDINNDIEGVTFFKGKIILLLKNGMHWELGKKQFNFGNEHEAEGDLYWLKDKQTTTFFKTMVKKLKGIKKPSLAVIEEQSC